jgi:hypothetical protein
MRMEAQTAITMSATVVTLLAVLTTNGGARVHAGELAPVHVSIHFGVDPSIRSRVVSDYVKQEAASLWRPYGVQIDWTDETAVHTATGMSPLEASVERRIAGAAAHAVPRVLGQVSAGVDTPDRQPILVSVDATERVLALRLNRPFPLGYELARALGRVLAHEIGHVLLGPPYHDDEGLMRPAFRPNELADHDRAPFRLTCGAVNRLRHRIRLMADDRQFAWSAAAPADGLEAIGRDRFEAAPCLPGAPRRPVES